MKFIEEVGKNRETAAAAKGKGPLPTGNWLHQFENFEDIIKPGRVGLCTPMSSTLRSGYKFIPETATAQCRSG